MAVIAACPQSFRKIPKKLELHS